MIGERDDVRARGQLRQKLIGRRAGRASLAGEQLENRLWSIANLARRRRGGESENDTKTKKFAQSVLEDHGRCCTARNAQLRVKLE
jgi:hypothetical protein